MDNQELLKIKSRKKGKIIILDLEGKLIGTTAMELKKVIDEIIQLSVLREVRLILNLSQVSIIDSSGLAMIIYTYTCFAPQRSGRVIILDQMSYSEPRFPRTILQSCFEIYDNEAKAIDTFQ